MRSFVVSSTAALALTACATITMQSPPENPQTIVNERVAIMKNFAGALGAAGQFAQGKGTSKDAMTKLTAARTGADRLAYLFPPGTALGDRGVANSRALSTIFSKRDDFGAKRENLVEVLAVLDTAVSQRTKAEVAKQVATTKDACLACHTKYRAAEE